MPEKKLNGRHNTDLLSLLQPKTRQSIFDKIGGNFELGRVQFTDNVGVDENKFLHFFRNFGVLLERSTTQLVGTCPVCGKHKFFANAATGCWDCKTCPFAENGTPASGNIYGFASWFSAHCFNQTTEEDYAELAKRRKFTISIEVMREFQICLNRVTNEWMLPGISLQKNIVNLYSYRQLTDDKGHKYQQIVSAPMMSQILYNAHNISASPDKPLWICEGHWDTLALLTLLAKLGVRSKHDVVGICGSTGFPKQMVNILNGRTVHVVMDNDEQGRSHAQKLTNLLASSGTTPTEYKVIEWRKEFRNEYDVSDLCAGEGLGS